MPGQQGSGSLRWGTLPADCLLAWQSSKNQSIGWLSTSNRSSDETTDYQRLITANTHFLVGSDWFPTIAIVVEKSGDFTVVGCDCLDNLTE
eukprot:scaffold46997_cov59-Cyclotella_meneghiniana.AAC.2